MPTVMLTDHFSLQEMTYSETASREGLDNKPDRFVVANLQRLAEVMEQVRSLCGGHPVTSTSGYRSPEVNAAIGGSSTSAHMSGLACDFIIPECGDPIEVCRAIEPHLADLQIDQLIREFDNPEGTGWIHLGLSDPIEDARCECLTITNAGTSEGF